MWQFAYIELCYTLLVTSCVYAAYLCWRLCVRQSFKWRILPPPPLLLHGRT